MRIDWKHIAYALAALPVVAIVFAWIGFFNIGASSGHWKITEWALHTAMRAAVKTYAFLEVDPPAELPREGLQPAAGHFARGCAICHGAPGEPRSPTLLRMLPVPPDLAGKVGEWNDAELFWIAMHGVRFTGMPAWPTQARDDEVWAMVAFLRALPEIDAGEYRRLAYGTAPPLVLQPRGFEQSLAECARCHDGTGLGGGELTPILAGQSAAYLAESLRAFADDRRHGGVMALPARAIEPAEIEALARHFAEQPAALAPVSPGKPDSVAAEIVARGIPDRSIPACSGCHGEGGGRNPLYPRVSGQKPDYIAGQLRLFREGKRGGGPFAHLMTNAARHLTEEEIDALARYLGSPDSNATGTVSAR